MSDERTLEGYGVDAYLEPCGDNLIDKYRCKSCGLLDIAIQRWGCDAGPFCICPGSTGAKARKAGYYPETDRDKLRKTK